MKTRHIFPEGTGKVLTQYQRLWTSSESLHHLRCGRVSFQITFLGTFWRMLLAHLLRLHKHEAEIVLGDSIKKKNSTSQIRGVHTSFRDSVFLHRERAWQNTRGPGSRKPESQKARTVQLRPRRMSFDMSILSFATFDTEIPPVAGEIMLPSFSDIWHLTEKVDSWQLKVESVTCNFDTGASPRAAASKFRHASVV